MADLQDEQDRRPIVCRGVRGATTATNTKDAILEATRDLLTQIVEANALQYQDIARMTTA